MSFLKKPERAVILNREFRGQTHFTKVEDAAVGYHRIPKTSFDSGKEHP
jgi:hypothetical protein